LDWTPVPAGTPHYLRVLDFAGADDEAGYLSAGAFGSTSMFLTQTGPDVPAVIGVAWVGVFARIRRSGPQQPIDNFGPVIGEGLVYEGISRLHQGNNAWTDFDPESDPAWRTATNPVTGQAWTWAEALAAPIGVKNHTTGQSAIRCTLLRKRVMVAFRGNTRWDSAVRMNR
jgi:hypothetical protein